MFVVEFVVGCELVEDEELGGDEEAEDEWLLVEDAEVVVVVPDVSVPVMGAVGASWAELVHPLSKATRATKTRNFMA